jgi:ribosomal protein S18 acetylase RimI-like enzyme
VLPTVSVRREIVPVSRALLPHAVLLVEHALADTPYLAGALDALRSAVSAPGADGRALASMREERLEGVMVFGFFAGAHGAGRVQLAVTDAWARRTHAGTALMEEATTMLRADDARFVLAELPDDPRALRGARAFLETSSFREEGRVEDFYRSGVALSFMRRELHAR